MSHMIFVINIILIMPDCIENCIDQSWVTKTCLRDPGLVAHY
jgi:hypothetical protein